MRYVRIKFCGSQKYGDLGHAVRKKQNVHISKDLSPEGRWTYLDGGVFRVFHRNEVDPKSLPYEPLFILPMQAALGSTVGSSRVAIVLVLINRRLQCFGIR